MLGFGDPDTPSISQQMRAVLLSGSQDRSEGTDTLGGAPCPRRLTLDTTAHRGGTNPWPHNSDWEPESSLWSRIPLPCCCVSLCILPGTGSSPPLKQPGLLLGGSDRKGAVAGHPGLALVTGEKSLHLEGWRPHARCIFSRGRLGTWPQVPAEPGHHPETQSPHLEMGHRAGRREEGLGAVELGCHILPDQAQRGSHCLGHLDGRAGQSWAGLLSLGLASPVGAQPLLLSWDPLHGTAWEGEPEAAHG